MKNMGEHPIPDDEYDRYEDVLRAVEKRQAVALPDRVVDLAALQVTQARKVTLPGVGEFRLNDWAYAQLAQLAGVAIKSAKSSPAHLNECLMALTGKITVRTMHDVVNDGGAIVRAFLDPTVAPPPDDAAVFRAMAAALGDVIDECRFRDLAFTEAATYCTILVGREISSVYGTEFRGGFHLRASEVGAGLALDTCCLRREDCTCRALFDGIDIHDTSGDALARTFGDAVEALPDRQHRSLEWMRAARRLSEPGAEEVLGGLLAEVPTTLRKATLRAVETARVALGQRALSRFDAALLMADIAYGAPPDVRFAMERLAGDYLTTSPPPLAA